MDSSEKSIKSEKSNKSTGSLSRSNLGGSVRNVLSTVRKSLYNKPAVEGANIQTLRGTTGADFEGKGKIWRRRGVAGCGCLYGGRNTSAETKGEKILLIKGPFCFIYKEETSESPKYAISLGQIRPNIHQSNNKTVYLETHLGDIEYEIIMSDEKEAKKFATVVREQAAIAETEEVRKKLGHQHLLVKRDSVRFAESVAMKKVENQPSAPFGVDEIATDSPAFSGI